MGTRSQKRELPVEWDILASISDRCLKGRAEGFIETEIVKQLPASLTWRLYDHDTEYGTVEISKVGPGVSQVFFSGLGFSIGLTKEQQQVRDRHYQDVIKSYFFMLSQESIWKEDNFAAPETLKAKATKEWKCWEHMPDSNEKERTIVRMGSQGWDSKSIGSEVNMSPGAVDKVYSNMKELHKKARIPYRQRGRRKKSAEVS